MEFNIPMTGTVYDIVAQLLLRVRGKDCFLTGCGFHFGGRYEIPTSRKAGEKWGTPSCDSPRWVGVSQLCG